jgi:integrase
MARLSLPGAINRRPNGKFTAVSPEVFDPKLGRRRRLALGTFGTRREAEGALERFERERRESGLVLDTAEVRTMNLHQYLVRWLRLVDRQAGDGEISPRTATGYRSAIDLHVIPYLGDQKVGDLNHLVIHEWLGWLRSKGLADRTVLRVYRTLHRALGDTPLRENPAHLPKHLVPKVRNEKSTYRPTPAEILVFLEHTECCELSDYLAPMWRVAAVTGMRRGELIGMTWDDVDLDRGRLDVVRSVGVDNKRVFVKAPKSEAGRRRVGLDQATTLAIKKLHQRVREDRLALGQYYEQTPLGLDLVFRWDSRGGLCRPDRTSATFTQEWRHAGLSSPATLHSLRHSLGSLLLAEGHAVTAVAAQLGHTPQVLLATYGRDLDQESRVASLTTTTEALFGRRGSG